MLDQTEKDFEKAIDRAIGARRVELSRAEDFSIGTIDVRPSMRTLAGPAGEVMLEPKVMQVLVALGTPVGAIQSRDDLIERCWDGRVIGDTSINRVVSLLRKGLSEAGGEAVSLEGVCFPQVAGFGWRRASHHSCRNRAVVFPTLDQPGS